MALWRLLLSHPSVDPYYEHYEAINAMRCLCRQSYLELKAAVPPFNLYGKGPCTKYNRGEGKLFIFRIAAEMLLKRSVEADDLLQVKRVVKLLTPPTVVIYYHCRSIQMLDYAIEVLPGALKEWSEHLLVMAAQKDDVEMIRHILIVASPPYRCNILRYCNKLSTVKLAVEELGVEYAINYIMHRESTVDMCRYAKSKGATDYDSMLYNAVIAKNIRLCRLARKWGAVNVNHALTKNASVPIYKALKSWGATNFHGMLTSSGYYGNRKAFNLARKWGKYSWSEIFCTACKHGIPRLAMWVLDSVGLSMPAISDKFQLAGANYIMWDVCERMYNMADRKTRRLFLQQRDGVDMLALVILGKIENRRKNI